MHEETHGDGYRFYCQIKEGDTLWGCGKGFRKRSDLTRHINRAGAGQCEALMSPSAKLVVQPTIVKLQAANTDASAHLAREPADYLTDDHSSVPLDFNPAEHSGTSIIARYPVFGTHVPTVPSHDIAAEPDSFHDLVLAFEELVRRLCDCTEHRDNKANHDDSLGKCASCNAFTPRSDTGVALLKRWHNRAWTILGAGVDNYTSKLMACTVHPLPTPPPSSWPWSEEAVVRLCGKDNLPCKYDFVGVEVVHSDLACILECLRGSDSERPIESPLVSPRVFRNNILEDLRGLAHIPSPDTPIIDISSAISNPRAVNPTHKYQRASI
jgi:hypothetical protein